MLNPDAVSRESANNTPSRRLTSEERRAFRREQRYWAIVFGIIIAIAISAPIVFLVMEVAEDSEAREKAAREANYIPPR